MALYLEACPFTGKQRIARLLMAPKIKRYRNVFVSAKFNCDFTLPNIQENIGFDIFINGVYESTIEFIIDRVPVNELLLILVRHWNYRISGT